MGGQQLLLFEEFALPSILIVDSPYTSTIKEVSEHAIEVIQPTVVPSLESVVLSQYSVCVLSNQKDLMSEQVQKNLVTPVLFIASRPEIDALVSRTANETPEEAVNRALEKYNLFDISDIENRFETIRKAFSQKQLLLSYIRKLPREITEDLFQKTYDPPRFITFFHDVMLVYDELDQKKIIPDEKKKEVAFNALLMQKMREWNFCRLASKFEKSVEKETLEMAMEYLKQRESGVRKSPLLGHGSYSEESVDRLSTSLVYTFNPTPDEFRWRVARLIVDDAHGNDHKKIANQRYSDSENLQNLPEFHTTMIYKPLHLDSVGNKSSFLLMQDIEGPTLDSVFKKVTEEINRSNKKDVEKTKKLIRLRNSLLHKYVKDIIFWQNQKLNTFIKKPAPIKILDDYFGRVTDITRLFSKIVPEFFSIDEHIAFIDSMKCLYSISISPDDVVRIRDATLKNVVLSMHSLKYDSNTQDYVFTIDDLFQQMCTTKVPSQLKIRDIFYHIDLHYRYGHILEDIAHLITAEESAFLIQPEKENKQFVSEKNVNHILTKFLKEVNRPQLFSNKQTIYLMLFYRSARKLKLCYDRYIKNDYKEFNRGEISKEVLEQRLKTKTETIYHHTRSCLTILDQLRRYVKQNTIQDMERLAKVEAYYKDANLKGYNADTAKLFHAENLKDISDTNLLLYARLSALSLTFRKMIAHLRYNPLHFENLVNNGN